MLTVKQLKAEIKSALYELKKLINQYSKAAEDTKSFPEEIRKHHSEMYFKLTGTYVKHFKKPLSKLRKAELQTIYFELKEALETK